MSSANANASCLHNAFHPVHMLKCKCKCKCKCKQMNFFSITCVCICTCVAHVNQASASAIGTFLVTTANGLNVKSSRKRKFNWSEIPSLHTSHKLYRRGPSLIKEPTVLFKIQVGHKVAFVFVW